MTALQWALLLLGAAIAVALIVSSRRERRMLQREAPPPATRDWGAEGAAPPPAAAPAAPAAPAQAEFDEFGVSRPRRRVAPGFAPSTGPGPAAPAERKPEKTPEKTPEKPSEEASGSALPEKVIGLYIAEHEGTNILGPKIHAALQARGLRYGHKRIYHRYEGERPVYSVASLVKPGALDPAESEGFATPGLSVFMVLPGPVNPRGAFLDMLETARALAQALNAELYDSELRAPLTVERERALREAVEAWARQDPAARGGA